MFGQDQDSVAVGFASEESWAGAMVNLRTYDRALSPAEVSALNGEPR